MGCCGQKRFAIAIAQPSVAERAPVAHQARLEYLAEAAILVRGPSTGRHYQFSAANRVQAVDPVDAGPLVKTGYFRVV
jgi:hypothetical protein